MNRKLRVVAGGVAVLSALAAGAWGLRTWRFIRPDFEWKTLEAEGIRFQYPAHWVDPLPIPEAPGIHISNRAPNEVSPQERGLPAMEMLLSDIAVTGQTEKTIDEYVAACRKGEEELKPVEVRRLANGLEVHTWRSVMELGEIAGDGRWIVFQKPTGEIYADYHLLPIDWQWRSRQEHLFWKILESIEFTEVAKKPA